MVLVEITWADDIPVLVRDPAKANAMCVMAQPSKVAAVVQVVVLVAMKRTYNLQRPCQPINGRESMVVAARCLMGNKNIGALRPLWWQCERPHPQR